MEAHWVIEAMAGCSGHWVIEAMAGCSGQAID